AAWLDQLPFADRADFEAASRGRIAGFDGVIKDAAGQPVWDLSAYRFLNDNRPADSVNPSLWRQAQLNNIAGLFQVSERLYQIRGFDLSNMNIIEGDSGLIIMDPLITTETARAGLELYFQHRPKKPVVAVIYTHAHADHFGGVRGVVDEADVKAGKVKIYAPEGFYEHAVSENILAGTAMNRRAQYMYGALLPRGERGQVDAGLGKSVPRAGTITLIPPTELIREPFESHRIDGIEVEFQLTPGTEAAAEMNLYFPQFRALCVAENAARVMHNVLTLRGAQVRDPKSWAYHLDQTLLRYGDKSDVLFAQHHWPTWGQAELKAFLADQRDMYAFINDQSLRLLNQGLTPLEIAERLKSLPPQLANKWYARGYYGSLSHNVRAVYQRYLGFYDGNPANLDPLPPVQAGERYVAAMGGAQALLKQARAAFAKGEYRWVAQLVNHLVFAEPDNQAARELQGDALEQLGYQSENATWRNIYLMGAYELRNGVPQQASAGSVSADIIRSMTPAMFFDYLGVRLNADRAQGHDMTMNWRFNDLGEDFALTLRNGVLTYRAGRLHERADVEVSLSKATLDRIALKQADFPGAIQQGAIRLDGKAELLGQFLGLLDSFAPQFNIVTP
ncbi:MAG: alkyl/aryl-sulfatase, partial [Pseudomonas sp.]